MIKYLKKKNNKKIDNVPKGRLTADLNYNSVTQVTQYKLINIIQLVFTTASLCSAKPITQPGFMWPRTMSVHIQAKQKTKKTNDAKKNYIHTNEVQHFFFVFKCLFSEIHSLKTDGSLKKKTALAIKSSLFGLRKTPYI